MSETTQLPSVDEIEQLWYEYAREAVELGKVKRLPNFRVVTADGEEITEDVVRVGPFNLVADGRYLEHVLETNSVRELQRQPSEARYINSTSAIVDAAPGSGFVRFGIDVTRGTLLSLLIQNPDQIEQIQQGGTPGYIIIGLGILGVLLSIERLITLSIASGKVSRQLKSDTPKKNNPLGRVLMVYEENKHADTETLELKLGEAILKEQPSLQRGILFIKIISVVAPLLGLLGTVVGMINTFQAIMLFGAGDATRMAGGISQALQTTKARPDRRDSDGAAAYDRQRPKQANHAGAAGAKLRHRGFAGREIGQLGRDCDAGTDRRIRSHPRFPGARRSRAPGSSPSSFSPCGS